MDPPQNEPHQHFFPPACQPVVQPSSNAIMQQLLHHNATIALQTVTVDYAKVSERKYLEGGTALGVVGTIHPTHFNPGGRRRKGKDCAGVSKSLKHCKRLQKLAFQNNYHRRRYFSICCHNIFFCEECWGPNKIF